ncbi:leucyl aminopeptidase [Gordonia sp. HY002]|uniref:leucyl aminopeptidase n=1 Tax=Gordonia zhenghanii TaxID=2911516 RepID=UPI001EF05631|nr:leucyl aminopeptidase [Gordonia zhenghanii]MCF8570831.1 leucyl aminopeptidase [Gordonia zhenghanii]MCF8605305.1 leucyl aminopeptidase [Gordonia zhenghanii]
MSSNDFSARERGPRIELTTALAKDDDVLVIGLTVPDADGEPPTLLVADNLFDDETADGVTAALGALGATHKSGALTTIPAPASLPVSRILAVGLGDEPDDAESLRKAAGNAIRALDGVATVASTLSAAAIGPVAEGFYLGAYRFDEFRTDKSRSDERPPSKVRLLAPKTKENRAELDRAVAVADSVAIARDLVNTPPSHLFPAEFAERARVLGSQAGLRVEILDDTELTKAGYGGIVGVGKGSSRPPRLVRLIHEAKGSDKKVALVGKGITFDTGGISLKPAAGMEAMTSDMGGAAAVIATAVAAARLDVGVTVIATVPMAENMPSGTAQRPGDVLTQYGGTTVEVLNTDAEGRLVLADAIVRACEDEPDYLIDTATLTGAQMVALGTRTPGVLGTDEFRDRVAALSQSVGENGWPMPMPTELRADLDSRVADLANVTNHRWGGMLSAAMFLREFVADDVGWAHVDVAGPAFNSGGPWGYTAKGGTGVPVRTLVAVLEDIADKG